MKSLVEGSTVVQQIGEELRNNVLNPARETAKTIVADAEATALDIRKQAEQEAAALLAEARLHIETEKRAFQISLKQACKQALGALRHAIETELLNPELHQFAAKALSNPHTVAKLITAIIQAVEKEGLTGDFTLILSQALTAEEILAELAPSLKQTLHQGKVLKGKFAGGVKLRFDEKRVTIDISDEALVELLSTFREGFREALFSHV